MTQPELAIQNGYIKLFPTIGQLCDCDAGLLIGLQVPATGLKQF